jgi:hypothetical protein
MMSSFPTNWVLTYESRPTSSASSSVQLSVEFDVHMTVTMKDRVQGRETETHVINCLLFNVPDPRLVFSSPPVSTMSRRESRASMGAARQHDALFEFESCELRFLFHFCHGFDVQWPVKKKFLLANKHITKCVVSLGIK